MLITLEKKYFDVIMIWDRGVIKPKKYFRHMGKVKNISLEKNRIEKEISIFFIQNRKEKILEKKIIRRYHHGGQIE